MVFEFVMPEIVKQAYLFEAKELLLYIIYMQHKREVELLIDFFNNRFCSNSKIFFFQTFENYRKANFRFEEKSPLHKQAKFNHVTFEMTAIFFLTGRRLTTCQWIQLIFSDVTRIFV